MHLAEAFDSDGIKLLAIGEYQLLMRQLTRENCRHVLAQALLEELQGDQGIQECLTQIQAAGHGACSKVGQTSAAWDCEQYHLFPETTEALGQQDQSKRK